MILTGARQSGKATLLKEALPKHRYVSLDLPSLAEEAKRRPADFLAASSPPVVVDEVQYAPRLFRHLKSIIDANRHLAGQFILTGSQKFTLMREVADSLAGRCAGLELENLAAGELCAAGGVELFMEVSQLLTRGCFPEPWRDRAIDGATFFSSYLATHIERDVRQLLNITSLRDFERFLRMCATYSGQLLNNFPIATAVGVAVKTVNQSLSVLEASNQIVLLEPYFANVGKRVVKTPKLYFCDTGLLCYLLGVGAFGLPRSPFCGSVWETFVFAELRKLQQQFAPSAAIWFHRDQQGREVDFLWLKDGQATLLECKWNEHPTPQDARSMGEVGALLRGAQPVALAEGPHHVVARPAHPFTLSAHASAVHGLCLRETLNV